MNKQRWDGGGGGGGGGRGGDGGGGRNSRRNNMNQDRDRSPIGNNNDRGGGNGGYGNSGFGGNMGGGGGGNNNNNNNNNSNNMGSGGGNNNNNMGGGGGNRGGSRNDGFSGRNDGGSGRGDMGGRGGNRGGNDMGSGGGGGGGGGNGNGNGNNIGIGGGGFEMGAMNDIQYNKGNFNTQSRQMPQMMQPQIQPQCIPPPMQQEPTNDCEIIVVARTLTEYAEAIETRLKNLGLMVDLLFPNDDVPIGKVLANISSRGCLYAIVVTPQNEEHQSITVNLLHGQPAEHRNMPVDDAIELIVTNFDEVLRSRRGGGGGGGVSGNTNINSIGNINDRMPTLSSSSSAAPPLNKQHPDAIQKLLNILADNRVLTVLQYDVILKYLGERRELQLGVELGDDYVKTNNPMTNIKLNSNNPTMPTTTILSSTVGAMSSSTVAAAESIIDGELEIQKKLMEILNKPSITTNSISNIIDKNKNSIGAAVAATAVGAKIPVLGQSSSGLISDHLHHHNQNQQQQQQFNQTGNKSKIGSIGGGGGGGGIAEKQLLHDPKVQMALDSLLQKNLFKL